MNPIIRNAVLSFVAVGLAGGLHAQTLTDIHTAPSPGTNDISQLSTNGDQTGPDGLNYYSNNNPAVGQTFATGTNAMKLVSVAIKTAGLNHDPGNIYGTPASTPTYYLSIYSMSGSTATLLVTFSAANPGFTDGDWLQWSDLNVLLGTNKTYAYSFGVPGSSGWAALAVATNAYAGGEIAVIPTSGGTITTGGSHKFDAVFDLGFQPGPTNIPASMPWPIPTYGWNLGNTLEATWGVPSYTAAPFYTAANAGFNAVRIPASWDFNATTNISGGVTNYPINPAFMAKVKQTVDWAIGAGMYVVINDHWDDGWLDNALTNGVNPIANAKMNSYWTQIATNFAGYDNHLLFAAANEPAVNNTAQEVTLMYYYQTFVNAVRATGGNNTNRWLVIQSVSDPTWMNALPTDTVSNRLMVEYHQYTPSLFTIIHDDPSWGNSIYFWGPAYHYSGDASRNATWGEEYAIDSFHQQLVDLYVSKGIPVMIGEFGAWTSSLTNATESTWNNDSVAYWNKYTAESARGHGLSPFYWSTPSNPFDWNSGAVVDAQRVSVLMGGAAPPPPNGAPYAASGLTATGGTSQVILSWTAGSGATSYNLYRSTASGLESSNAAPVVTGITGTSYTNTGLNSGITYYYQVVAVSNSLSSGFSAEANATTSGSTDTAQFNFETGTQGWSGGGGIVSGVATSTAQHYAGNQSLAVNFNGSSSGTASPYVNNVAVVPGSTITFHVWIPSGSQISALQPYIQDKNYTWSSSWYPSFAANAWNTLTLSVPANAVSPLANLGVQFVTSAGWTGTCYIDSVSLPASGPDFTLSANPASLTVNGGTNGASTVTVTAINGLDACYTLSVSNLPSGVSAAFTNNPSTGGASLLTLTASNNVISGTTNVTVFATAGLISHTQTIALTLTGPTNTPPVLAAITNRTVNFGQTVAFTATATDTDQPPQTLTFTLQAGATNATLNTNSGAFSWTPPVGFGGTSNLFTISVADNGTPSLSATQSFYVTVNKQTPVLTAPAATAIVYGQTLTNSSLIGGSATNAANNAAVAGGFAFTVPTTAPGAGTASQSVTFTPTDTTDYNSATVNVSVTVSHASLTITASARSKTYGTALTLGTTAFTSSGLTNSDTITGVTLTASGSPAGDQAAAPVRAYTVTPSAATGTGLTNYTISYATNTLTVSQLAVALSGIRTYDGTTNAAAANLSVTNTVNGDTVTVAGGIGGLAGADVGTNTITSFGSLALDNNAGTNYTLSGASGSMVITNTPLVITANNDSKTYDGNAYSGGNGVAYAGFVNGETNTVLTGSLTYGGSAESAITVGSYNITPSGCTSANYLISYVSGTLTINQATPVINTPPTASAIIYGQTLGDSLLSGGSATPSGGSFAFTAPSTVPPVGTANYSVTYTPTDTTDYTNANTMVSVTVNPAFTPSTNAYLASLAVNPPAGSLPGFATNVYSYLVTNAYTNNPVTVTASSADTNATMTFSFNNVSAGSLTNGVASGNEALLLNPPTNTVTVTVVSQDLSQTNVYTVNVLLQPSQTVPKLTNSVSGTTLTLSWPADHLGYRLLTQTNNLNKGVSSNTNDWMPVSGSTAITTTNITMPKTNLNEYYRLVYP